MKSAPFCSFLSSDSHVVAICSVMKPRVVAHIVSHNAGRLLNTVANRHLSVKQRFPGVWGHHAKFWVTVALSVVNLNLVSTNLAMAAYIPPSDASAPTPGNTSTGTVRGGGCSGRSEGSLTPFAPQTHIGQTVSLQPTLVWFTPETQPYWMEFRIVEVRPDNQFQTVYETEFQSGDRTNSLGIGHFDLSTTDVKLATGRTYRWQVVLVCNPSFPSESLMAEADVTVVDAQASLETALMAATTRAERVDVYAEAGLWYDAMAEAVGSDPGNSSTANPADGQSSQLALLQDLVTIEKDAEEPLENTNDTSSSYASRMQQIINLVYGHGEN